MWQRFNKYGPIAILKMWDEYCSLIWSCDDEFFEHLMQLSDELFIKELNNYMQSPPEKTGIDFIKNLLPEPQDMKRPPNVSKIFWKKGDKIVQ